MEDIQKDKKIGVIVATIIGMNAMIGAGIFSVPAALACKVGPAGIVSYAFVILAVWCMGSSIALLARLFPEEGSFYVYAKQWGGHTTGIIAAGSYLIGLVVAMGLLAQVAGMYMVSFLHHSTTSMPFLSAMSVQGWSLLTIGFFMLLNMAGVVLSEIGQYILICTTVFPLIVTTILCFSHMDINNLYPFMPYGFTNILAATKAVIFGFFGFECAASLFAVVHEPEKNVNRALTWAIILVGTLYLLFVASLILAIPSSQFCSGANLPDLLQVHFSQYPFLVKLVRLSLFSAVFGTIHSMMWSASGLLIAFVKKIRSLDAYPSLRQHHVAVGIIAAGIMASCVSLKNIDLFFSYTAVFIICAFMLSMFTLIKERYRLSWLEWMQTVIGLLTACIIVYFAVEEIIMHSMY